ncbi:MAG: DUF2934 domain-containing protein [Candidatus Sulfotelmatobacter sp.]
MNRFKELELDIKSRRQELMVKLVERQVRSRAQQLYETRGQAEGAELQDWFQAESEVLGNSILAPLYRRMRTSENGENNKENQEQSSMEQSAPDFAGQGARGCENAV